MRIQGNPSSNRKLLKINKLKDGLVAGFRQLAERCTTMFPADLRNSRERG